MSKTIVARNIKTIRLFGGKRYQLMTEVLNVGKSSKERAEKWAEGQRKNGYSVRVVPTHGGYALYLRKGTMGL